MNYLKTLAPDLSGLRIAMDCANGAAYRVGPKVFQAAGADVFAVYTTPDGRNINRGCGSTHMDHLQRIVREGSTTWASPSTGTPTAPCSWTAAGTSSTGTTCCS